MLKLAVLGSTRGSNLAPFVEQLKQQKVAAEVVLVVSDKADALILERARELHISTHFADPKNLTRAAFADALTTVLKNHHIDLVVLIGFMRILAPNFIDTWRGRIINVHPSLLPKHAGLMDLAVHQAVLDAGETESGCSVHLVEEVVDAGKVIVQKRCLVAPDEMAETLKAKVQQLEVAALVEAVRVILNKS